MTNKKDSIHYDKQSVATDCVIFGFDEGELKVLLVKRAIKPFMADWCFPGGLIHIHETAEEAARRILEDETGIKDMFVEQLYTFSSIDRDPRYRVVSISYYALVSIADWEVHAGENTSDIKWFALSEIPSLAFDHEQILEVAKERLQGKIRYQPIGFELLGEKFTIPELHKLYETVLQTELDRRNFSKKILSFGLLIDLGEYQRGARNRAPKLYKFDDKRYKELSKKGFYFEM